MNRHDEDKNQEIHRGLQWRVTAAGYLETLNESYAIERARIAEMGWGQRSGLLSWPIHLAEKAEWFNLDDFEAAFRVALRAWAPHVPESLIVASIKRAREDFDYARRFLWKGPHERLFYTSAGLLREYDRRLAEIETEDLIG